MKVDRIIETYVDWGRGLIEVCSACEAGRRQPWAPCPGCGVIVCTGCGQPRPLPCRPADTARAPKPKREQTPLRDVAELDALELRRKELRGRLGLGDDEADVEGWEDDECGDDLDDEEDFDL